jgi:hypothetical protein
MGDLKTKGKDIVEPQLENIKNQFVPMKIWVRFKLHFFYTFEYFNWKAKLLLFIGWEYVKKVAFGKERCQAEGYCKRSI